MKPLFYFSFASFSAAAFLVLHFACTSGNYQKRLDRLRVQHAETSPAWLLNWAACDGHCICDGMAEHATDVVPFYLPETEAFAVLAPRSEIGVFDAYTGDTLQVLQVVSVSFGVGVEVATMADVSNFSQSFTFKF